MYNIAHILTKSNLIQIYIIMLFQHMQIPRSQTTYVRSCYVYIRS